MVKKSMIFVFALMMGLGLLNESRAQTYATGIGLRAGVSNGLTVKHFIQSDVALEGILHSRWRGLVLTGLYEVHKDIREVRGLRWFYGGGAHIGSWNSGNTVKRDYSGTTIVGIDGIIGLDFKFADAPINLSLDYKPAFNIINDAGFWGDEVALSIRFTF
ncbi:hypothetical protein [Cyclobacterium salsum]|uniref:hypothetical protein n=1 Tax=Cyclobacterium salsum TaxID=2666329 RepID=UPI0013916C3F|nr:hypothetical protein [Cyclobacterium salsum]